MWEILELFSLKLENVRRIQKASDALNTCSLMLFWLFFYLVVFPLLLQCYISLCSLIVMALNCVSSTFLAVRNVKPAPCKHVIKDYLLILKQTWFLLFWHLVLRYTNSSFLRVAALICQLRLFIHSHSLQSVFIQDSDQQWFIRVGFFHPIWSLFIL